MSTVEQGSPQNASAFLPEANIGPASAGFNVRVTVNAGSSRGFTQGSKTQTWQPLLLSVWVDAVDSRAFRERVDQILAAGEVARSVVRESRLSLLPITLGVTQLGAEDVTYRVVDGIEDWTVRPRKAIKAGCSRFDLTRWKPCGASHPIRIRRFDCERLEGARMNLLPLKQDGQQFSAADLNRVTQEIEPPTFPSTTLILGSNEATQFESDFLVLARGNDTVYLSFKVTVSMFNAQTTTIGIQVNEPTDWTIAAFSASVQDANALPVPALVRLPGTSGQPEVEFQSDTSSFQFTALCQVTLVRN
ncbi:MAG: hypothetical protein HC933_06425 [Pleurocapsa sp. SU_196_0]|nr:hypothetical protein [Pleurocapsa sp. SU_196_0]